MSYASNGENERLQKLRTELENIVTLIEAEQKILEEEIKNPLGKTWQFWN